MADLIYQRRTHLVSLRREIAEFSSAICFVRRSRFRLVMTSPICEWVLDIASVAHASPPDLAFLLYEPDAPPTDNFVFVTPGYCQIFVRNLFSPSLTLPARNDFAYLRMGVGFRVRCSRVPAGSCFFALRTGSIRIAFFALRAGSVSDGQIMQPVK